MQKTSPVRQVISVDPSWRIGIVHSSYYKEEIQKMIESAQNYLIKAGISSSNITLHPVYGSFEIPLIGSALVQSQKVDALIGLGIIVEGETHHARILAEQSAQAIMTIQVQYAIPFAFEILYVHDLAQAQARHNKGAEAAASVLHSLAQLREIRS